MSKLEDVAEFHQKMGFYPYVEADEELKAAVNKKRINIIKEEAAELAEALESEDPVSILHESVDVLYVVYGALLERGLSQNNLDVAWEMVQAANMKKTPPENPLDKAEKGKSWKKADVRKALSVKSKLHTYLISYSYKVKHNSTWNHGHATIDVEGKMNRARAEQCLGLIAGKHEVAKNGEVAISNIVDLTE